MTQVKKGQNAEHDNTTLENMGENEYEMLTEVCNKIWEEERISKEWELHYSKKEIIVIALIIQDIK